jgi:hypothetical protein
MSFNLGEMSRCCISVASCNVVLQTVVAFVGGQAGRHNPKICRLEQGRKVTSAGGFLELSSLLASNLSLP